MTATEVLSLIEAAAGGDPGPLDAAIDDLNELVGGLERARKALARVEPPAAGPEPEPVGERAVPRRRPGRPAKATTDDSQPRGGFDNWRLAIAKLVAAKGPMKAGAIIEEVGCPESSYYKAVQHHPWFEKTADGLALTTEGRLAARKMTGQQED